MQEAEDDEVPDLKLDGERPAANGLMCFLNDTRECGADCMAYTPQPSEAPNLSMQQKNCILIVSMERLGRYGSGIVTLMKKSVDNQADRARHTPTPNPMGKS